MSINHKTTDGVCQDCGAWVCGECGECSNQHGNDTYSCINLYAEGGVFRLALFEGDVKDERKVIIEVAQSRRGLAELLAMVRHDWGLSWSDLRERVSWAKRYLVDVTA